MLRVQQVVPGAGARWRKAPGPTAIPAKPATHRRALRVNSGCSFQSAGASVFRSLTHSLIRQPILEAVCRIRGRSRPLPVHVHQMNNVFKHCAGRILRQIDDRPPLVCHRPEAARPPSPLKSRWLLIAPESGHRGGRFAAISSMRTSLRQSGSGTPRPHARLPPSATSPAPSCHRTGSLRRVSHFLPSSRSP